MHRMTHLSTFTLATALFIALYNAAPLYFNSYHYPLDHIDTGTLDENVLLHHHHSPIHIERTNTSFIINDDIQLDWHNDHDWTDISYIYNKDTIINDKKSRRLVTQSQYKEWNKWDHTTEHHKKSGRFIGESKYKRRYNDASAMCHEFYAELASIQNSAENAVVQGLCSTLGEGSCWIGLQKDTKKGKWLSTTKWVDGHPLAYTNWAQGQPSDQTGKENCAEIYSSTKGQWSSVPCNRERYAICEDTVEHHVGEYIGVEKKASWYKGNLYCKLKYGSELATILQRYQQRDAQNACASRVLGRDIQDCWIGFKKNPGFLWGWTGNDDIIQYGNWGINQPVADDGKNCAFLNAHQTSGVWENDECTQEKWIICNAKEQTVATRMRDLMFPPTLREQREKEKLAQKQQEIEVNEKKTEKELADLKESGSPQKKTTTATKEDKSESFMEEEQKRSRDKSLPPGSEPMGEIKPESFMKEEQRRKRSRDKRLPPPGSEPKPESFMKEEQRNRDESLPPAGSEPMPPPMDMSQYGRRGTHGSEATKEARYETEELKQRRKQGQTSQGREVREQLRADLRKTQEDKGMGGREAEEELKADIHGRNPYNKPSGVHGREAEELKANLRGTETQENKRLSNGPGGAYGREMQELKANQRLWPQQEWKQDISRMPKGTEPNLPPKEEKEMDFIPMLQGLLRKLGTQPAPGIRDHAPMHLKGYNPQSDPYFGDINMQYMNQRFGNGVHKRSAHGPRGMHDREAQEELQMDKQDLMQRDLLKHGGSLQPPSGNRQNPYNFNPQFYPGTQFPAPYASAAHAAYRDEEEGRRRLVVGSVYDEIEKCKVLAAFMLCVRYDVREKKMRTLDVVVADTMEEIGMESGGEVRYFEDIEFLLEFNPYRTSHRLCYDKKHRLLFDICLEKNMKKGNGMDADVTLMIANERSKAFDFGYEQDWDEIYRNTNTKCVHVANLKVCVMPIVDFNDYMLQIKYRKHS